MPDIETVKCLVEIFNDRFSKHDLILTDEDIERGSGEIENGDDGWPLQVPYRFGADADGDYLDYYFSFSYHQMVPDHYRIRCDRRDEQLPVVAPFYSYPSEATEEEKTRRKQEYHAENSRISGMLCAKGFESSSIRNDKPVLAVYVSRRDADGIWVTKEELTFICGDNYIDALGAAMWIVDDALASLHRHNMTADELLALYRAFGPDPYIRYENRPLARAANPISASFVIYQPIPFNAWGYAELSANRLCGTPLEEPSRSLAGWQRRYDCYDKHRMESQLFLNRVVRLTQDIFAGNSAMPAGSIGKIAPHGRLVDTDTFDYIVAIPVMFEPTPLPLWRQLANYLFDRPGGHEPLIVAVPYDALEFVESDAVYAAYLDEVYAEIR
ncbi:MAG: hypothetical protein ACOYL3_23250 [Desulfuromonadaceae bacterium]